MIDISYLVVPVAWSAVFVVSLLRPREIRGSAEVAAPQRSYREVMQTRMRERDDFVVLMSARGHEPEAARRVHDALWFGILDAREECIRPQDSLPDLFYADKPGGPVTMTLVKRIGLDLGISAKRLDELSVAPGTVERLTAVLTALMRNEEPEPMSARLLRPSEADAANRLLRPTAGRTEPNPARLLRPATQDDEQKEELS